VTWANVKGIAYMVGIAAVFGYWQHQSFLAGVFMFLFLVYLEKLGRVLIWTLGALPESIAAGLRKEEKTELSA
jgi:hypothetical protein